LHKTWEKARKKAEKPLVVQQLNVQRLLATYLSGICCHLEAQVDVCALVESFERRVAELEERNNRNSTNSSMGAPKPEPI
jgi:hypothetical protein